MTLANGAAFENKRNKNENSCSIRTYLKEIVTVIKIKECFMD